MLATCIHLLRGTPYIYQGEELGMTNAGFTSIDQYRDVESRNYYQILLDAGKTPAEALDILAARSRDNARTPMQWDAGENAGFTDGEPWIPVQSNYREINAEAALRQPDSVFHYYQALIRLRKELLVIQEGDISFLYPDQSDVFAYRRTLTGKKCWCSVTCCRKNGRCPWLGPTKNAWAITRTSSGTDRQSLCGRMKPWY